MVGAHRQFVHNPESVQRLPELALLAGSILSFLTATAHLPKGNLARIQKTAQSSTA
jgi:hypothetical protein